MVDWKVDCKVILTTNFPAVDVSLNNSTEKKPCLFNCAHHKLASVHIIKRTTLNSFCLFYLPKKISMALKHSLQEKKLIITN